MKNLRLQITFKPCHLLTAVGNQIYVLPKNSYLRILNSIQLVKVNTTNQQPLKIGQSFYLYFHFTQQYVYYDTFRKVVGLTKNPEEKTQFKILTDHFDWNSRGQIEIGMLFKYRIILSEHSSKILHNENGELTAISNQNQYSLISFQQSIYNLDSISYPIHLMSLQNNLTLCYKNSKAHAQNKPSLCQLMMSLQKKPNFDMWAVKHTDTNSYLLKSGKQFIFMKQAPSQLKFGFKITNYDQKGTYFNLSTNDKQFISLSEQTHLAQISSENLKNILVKKVVQQQSIKNIIITAWLKAQLTLPINKTNIMYILQQCQNFFRSFSQVYNEDVVQGLITEGLLVDLGQIGNKYKWEFVGNKIVRIVQKMLRIHKSWVTNLFKATNLYQNLMKQEQIKRIVEDIQIDNSFISNPHQVLKDVENLIFKDKQVSLVSLQTLLIVTPLISLFGKYQQHRQLKQFVDFACDQVIPHLKKQKFSTFYSIGLKIVKANTKAIFFNTQIMKFLTLSVLQTDKLSLKDKLILIKIFEAQTGPYIYITTQSNTVRSITHEKKHQKSIAFFIEDILPKNCRFETYQFKTISVSLLKFHLKVNQTIELNDCKQFLKCLIESSTSYYYDQNPQIFLKECLQSFLILINRIFILSAEKSLQYDSTTTEFSERAEKCKNQICSFINPEVINIEMLWKLFEKNKKLSKYEEQIFILIIKIYQRIVCPQKYTRHLLQVIKVVEDPSPQLSKVISLFIMRQHQFNPIETSQKIVSLSKGMQQDQLIIIAHMINQNQMYENICFKADAFYKFINALATVKIIQSGILNGQKILQIVYKRRGPWLHNDLQFLFLRNLIMIIGGVVTMQIYQCFDKYVCSVQPDKWSLYFFRLCSIFFQMSPPTLKKRFVITYHDQLKNANDGLKLQKLFYEKGAQFVNYYIKLLLAFTDFHSSKKLIYQIMGDQTLFNLLQQFGNNIQLRIKILSLMIKARKRISQFNNTSANLQNIQWLKKGTFFIREKLGGESSSISESLQLIYLRDYTFVLIDFLQMRQQIISKSQVLQDDIIVFEGTNKIFAFKVSQLISQTVKNDRVQKNMLEKILWFQNKYKISIDTVELTQISIQIQKQQKKNENFQYNYMLSISQQVSKTSNFLLEKINIEVFLTTLIGVVLSNSLQGNPVWSNIQQLLNYLHYVVSYRNYVYTTQDIQLLFLALRKFIKYKKLNLAAVTQNIIRKTIWKQGKLQVNTQLLVQQNIMKFKIQSFDFLYQCIQNYTTFSPIYESTLNYFNHNGQKSICWSVSCYISTLRFMISLSKSLQFNFKQIFSESQGMRIEFIGQVIEVNRQHIKQIFIDTSEAKLTIIAYQIKLINNLLRGPVKANIETALKYKYENIISLFKLPDFHEDPKKANKFKIVVQIKKSVAEAILILSSFKKFNHQQIRLLELTFITYYNSTKKLVNDDLNSIIQKYTLENKHLLPVMNFDLALNLFYCIMKIYEAEGNFKIKKLRTQYLRNIKLVKGYQKKFKIFYQLYKIIVQTIGWLAKNVYKCFKKTADQIDQAIDVLSIFDQAQLTHQQNLTQTLKFFVKNVASVQIQINNQIQTVHFLLLKETKCYNTSIRKQLHRKVGLGQREYKLKKFLVASNHIILRLQIEKDIKIFTQKYKPVEILIKNRQLWKSLNFLCACLLNLIYLDDNIPEQHVSQYVIRCISYMFCTFLLLIYFIQNLPLKRKLSKQIQNSKDQKKFKKLWSCLEIVNDKTLWFATIYILIISLSFYQEALLTLLMLDFFVRFKISKQVTQIITRPIVQLFMVIIIIVQFSFILTSYQFFIRQSLTCYNVADCIQLTYQKYLGIYQNDVNSETLNKFNLATSVQFIFKFVTIMTNYSLIIGVLLYEKKSKDNKQKQWEKKVKQRCFICDTQRNIIDRTRNNNKGFFQHIQQQHNLWNYVFYLIYLKNKQLERLNITESVVLSQWKEEKIDWLPTTYKA